VSVAVMVPPGAKEDPLSEMPGPVTSRMIETELPPPGAGVKTWIKSRVETARSLPGSAAVSEVAETNVVGRAEPLTTMMDVGVKFAPVAVSVNGAEPTEMLVGEMLVSVGAGGGVVTVSVTLDDVPPPGAGLKTVIACVPVEATSVARIAAVNDVVDPNVVTRSLPSTRTIAPLTKPLPVTVSVKAALPAATLIGAIVVIAGTGVATVIVALVASFVNVLLVNHRRLHVMPTVAGAVNVSVAPVNPLPGAVRVLLMYFQSTYDSSVLVAGQYIATQSPGIPGPLASVAVMVPPGAAELLPSAIPGPVIVSVAALDVPPPGAGVNTVIAWVPAESRSVPGSVAVSDVAET
jgi:hypothetical protein